MSFNKHCADSITQRRFQKMLEYVDLGSLDIHFDNVNRAVQTLNECREINHFHFDGTPIVIDTGNNGTANRCLLRISGKFGWSSQGDRTVLDAYRRLMKRYIG